VLRASGDGVSETRNVLILCTGNSARSILAEAILNRDGAGCFRAFSAGSQPKGHVHPMALQVLNEFGLPTENLRSKSWDEFAGIDAPQMDLVITVCASAAGETCPYWPGAPIRAHWGIDDPAAIEGAGQRAAFLRAFARMQARIAMLLALPVDSLDAATLKDRLKEIGQIADAEPHVG
jgi:arsenate reductase